MSKWNHDGWHQDGWEDDGWNNDGHDFGWKSDSFKSRCDLSDCCEATCIGRNFTPYNKYISTKDSDGKCRIRTIDGGTGERLKCNTQGYCYATGENCSPSDCDC